MVTAKPKKSDKPKKPVGRPRKKLGTRVTDVPLVSTLRPRAARSNADSAALQRMKLAFKRDYPLSTGQNAFDEYKTRAILDAMADPSRGPIGSRVLGPSEFKVAKKKEKLEKALASNQPVVISDGRVLLNKRAISTALSTAAQVPAPAPVGPSLTLIPVPPVTATIPVSKPTSKRTRSQKRRLAREALRQGREYGARNQRAMEDEALSRMNKKRKTPGDNIPEYGDVPLELQTPYERELSNIRTTLRGDLDPEDRIKLVSRMRELRRQVNASEGVDITPLDEPSTHHTPTPAQEAKASRIVRKFTAKQLTEAAARMKAAEGITALKNASPVVVQEVHRQIGSLMAEEPNMESLAPLNAFQDLANAVEQNTRANERRTPLTENQRRSLDVAAQLEAEHNEPPPVFRPRSAPVAVIDVVREARENAARIAVERKARRQRQLEAAQAKVDKAEELEALAALAAQSDDYTRPTRTQRLSQRAAKENAAKVLSASIKRMSAQNALNEAIRQREEIDRRAIADQAMLEEDAIANERDARRSSAIAIQSAVKRALAQRQYNTQKEMADALVLDAERKAKEQQDAASTIQAAVRSALTRDALNQAVDSQAKQDAAIRVIQRAIRDKVEGVAKQKRIVSKIQEMNTRIPPPRPTSAPGMSQPTLEYGDLIDEIDLTNEFRQEDDAARQLQAALRRFADNRRFATAREIEAEYAAQNEIGVPGTDIRPNNRTIPVPPPLPPLPIRYVESKPRSTRASSSVKRLERAAAETGQTIPVMNYINKLVADTLREVVEEEVASKAQARIDEAAIQEQISRLRPVNDRAISEAVPTAQGLGESIRKAMEARRAQIAPEDDDEEEFGDGLSGGMRGCGQYTLQAITFPDTDWKTSSSLRWLRSNGIKPIKRADHSGSLYRYRIVDPKGFTKYYTSELMSRGRKINMVYGKP